MSRRGIAYRRWMREKYIKRRLIIYNNNKIKNNRGYRYRTTPNNLSLHCFHISDYISEWEYKAATTYSTSKWETRYSECKKYNRKGTSSSEGAYKNKNYDRRQFRKLLKELGL